MERRDIDIICNHLSDWEMYRNKTVMVTGATGRLGRYILEALIEVDIRYNLNLRVIGVARDPKKIETVFGETVHFPNVSIWVQDINKPITYEGAIDYIFHTAGPAAPVDFRDAAVETLWAHVNGTHNILECARTHQTKKVLYVSTVEVYGALTNEKDITEQDMGILQHVSSRACYPEAKRLCETMLASYQAEYGIEYCGVRLSHTLGPGIVLDDGRAFAEFIQHALKGEDIILYSDGSAMRTYTYVADAVNAMFLAMSKGEHCFYNVAADENIVSIRNLAELIAGLAPSHAVNVRFSDEAAHMPYLPFKLPMMDTTRIRALGWAPKVGLEKMFQWTMEAYM